MKTGSMNTRIIIAAGSSGGHIFPAIATTVSLKELRGSSEVIFIGSGKKLDKEIFENNKCDYYSLSARRRILSDLKSAFLIVKKFKPDVVVGFGGYVSFPVLLTAKMLGIPTIVHEQNMFPGFANRILSNFVDKMAVTFEDTDSFILKKSIIEKTGNPLRPNLAKWEKAEAGGKLGLAKNKFCVLIMGGSQGASFINSAAADIFRGMDNAQKEKIQCIHLSGVKDFEFVKSGYDSAGVENRVFAFLDTMSHAYSAADLVISRAGATSISEITFFGKPCILIPYPGKKVHQLENAAFLEKNGAAAVIEQQGFCKDDLKNAIFDLINNPAKLKAMAENSSRLARPDASYRLAGEILKMVKGK